MIAFDPSDHSYTVIATGERLLSVTQILDLAGLRPDYAGIPPHVLQHAAERGTYVGQCCNLYDEGDLDLDSVHPEAVPYVNAWIHFRDHHSYEPARSEVLLYHPELKVCGRADTVGVWDGVAVGDIKCTVKLDPAYRIQTAGYALPGMYSQGQSGEWVPFDATQRFLVHLKKDATYEVVQCDQDGDFAVFKAALEIAKWKTLSGLNGKGRNK